MIITIDTETQGLNAQKYIMGTICQENLKCKTYIGKDSWKEMYEEVLRLNQKCTTRHKRLTAYAHNLQYDYISIHAHQDKKNHIYSPSPFIADRITWTNKTQKNEMKWVDTMGLWRGPLEELGTALGYPKKETPHWLKLTEYLPNEQELQQAKEYMEQDARILMHYILKQRELLRKEGLKVQHIITNGQLAMDYFLKKLREKEREWGVEKKEYIPHRHKHRQEGRFFYDVDKGELWPEQHPTKVHQAVRGGRCQTYQTGETTNAWYIDINSLYPYISTIIRYPDLRRQRIEYEPKKNDTHRIGITRGILLTPKEPHHLAWIPIRTHEDDELHTTWPTTDEHGQKILLGTWTNHEIHLAQTQGYELLHTTWTITWDDGINPFKYIIPELYQKRLASTGIDKIFYKQLMNSLIGKFSQHREKIETTIIDPEELPHYQNEGWNVLTHDNQDLIITRNTGIDYKKYYSPITNALITAQARTYLTRHLALIPREHLWYTDTDSIIGTGPLPLATQEGMFKYGENMGEWKIVNTNQPLHVYGKKAYAYGDTAILNRVPKRYVTTELMKTGTIEYTDIIGIKEAQTPELIGTPITRTRTLHKEPTTQEHKTLYIEHQLTPTKQEHTHILTHLKKTRKAHT